MTVVNCDELSFCSVRIERNGRGPNVGQILHTQSFITMWRCNKVGSGKVEIITLLLAYMKPKNFTGSLETHIHTYIYTNS